MAADATESADLGSTVTHEAYVRQVVAVLADRGIDTSDLEISTGRKRTASMKITEREPFGAISRNADWIMLRWDEREGWSFQVHYPGDEFARGRVFFGFSAVPAPSQIASWLIVGLAHPDIEPNHEGKRFDTPDLENILRTYTATAL